MRLQIPLPDAYTLASPDELESRIRDAKKTLGDRLLVLGAGRTLLDLSIAGAIAEHRVIDATDGAAAPTPGSLVGAFPGPAGERLSLVRGDESIGGRPATLEEVVLGHLAAARKPRSASAEGRAA